jgi:hypothetical protein
MAVWLMNLKFKSINLQSTNYNPFGSMHLGANKTWELFVHKSMTPSAKHTLYGRNPEADAEQKSN